MTQTTAANRFRYRVQFESGSDPTQLPGDWVERAYTNLVREQAIFQAQRAGVVGANAGEACVTEDPIFSHQQPGEIAGLRFRVGDGPAPVEVTFDLQTAFGAAARAQLAKLPLPEGQAEQAEVLFRVFAEPDENGAAAGPLPPGAPQVRRKSLPLCDGSLDDWLAVAEPVGPIRDADYPLFIVDEAVETARGYLFKIGNHEGAALLLGHLYRQREPTPEVFGVVDAAIEIRHADQKPFSLMPTAQMYADLNAQMARRRARLGRADELPLVLAHNHPFLPSVRDGDDASCDACPKRPTCQLTSSFYSISDVDYHLCLFPAQPYVAGMVIGFTPRGEQDLRVFTMYGSQARQRGYYRLAKHSVKK